MQVASTQPPIDEEAPGKWPRRLLHVPSMISYEWQPGNLYGNHASPEYNAITYTWGRWRLEKGERPKVRPIKFGNVPWQVPRVKPERFTADELEKIIKLATGTGYVAPHEGPLPNVQFVWIDIACIDQRPNNPDSASEIGRQALIFNGARHVLVWLSTLPTRKLDHIIAYLRESSIQVLTLASMQHDMADTKSRQLLGKVHDELRLLFADNWFTSLWTLQEAYLRCDARLMSRQGIVPLLKRGFWKQRACLWDITMYCETLMHDEIEKAQPPPTPYTAIRNLIQDSGMLALSEASALAVYMTSGNRQFSESTDFIYGIQQIFGARVGKTAVHANPTQRWSVEALQLQLGQHLLQHHPILSQLHVFKSPAPVGRAWLVDRATSQIAPNSYIGSDLKSVGSIPHDAQNPIEVPWSVLTLKTIGHITWCGFSGPYCSFVKFNRLALKI